MAVVDTDETKKKKFITLSDDVFALFGAHQLIKK